MHVRNHLSAAIYRQSKLMVERSCGDGKARRTQLQMFLGTRHQLGNANVEAFGQREEFAREFVLADEEAQHFYEMCIERSFLDGEVIHF